MGGILARFGRRRSRLNRSTVEMAPRVRVPYEEAVKRCNRYASPLASEDLTEKCFALLREAQIVEGAVHIGRTEVTKRIRRGVDAVIIMAGDSPNIENILDLIGMCLYHATFYIFLPNQEDLCEVLKTEADVVMVNNNDEFAPIYNQVIEDIEALW